MPKQHTPEFVRWFRNSSPYINAFRNRTFVVAFGGEMLADAQFASLVHDLALLNSLGVRLVLVHGTRPQIEQCLQQRKADFQYVNGLRITDDVALTCVKQAAGSVRVDIEALLSMGLTNSPMAGARIRVVSGNFVTAQPLGVRHGVDYCHTGEVRRIDNHAIHRHLDDGAIVLLSPIGYSPTGEVFNLTAHDVATATAVQLQADKLIHLVDCKGITDNRHRLLRELTLEQAEALLAGKHKLNEDVAISLASAISACRQDVPRVHILSRQVDGALLLELFSRDGCGSLVMQDQFEDTRQAGLNDIGGILELIAPLEKDEVLVRRSRERLEMEIDHFTVVERDGMIVACAALYPFITEKVSELACLAVHPDYRNEGRGDALLKYIERQSRQLGIQHLFVLTTHTAHWFRERGFKV
ncbi:MAG: amino-acid N-acetyltransferase, partial [Halobacteria archaeon]|nr:amino-acid N-acetyltransferase [Halobacteria archaeon]